MLKRKWLFLGSLAGLVFAYLMTGSLYGIFNSSEQKDVDVSVMTFNARGFNFSRQIKADNLDSLIWNFITKKEPDILCFQESNALLNLTTELDQYSYKYVDLESGNHDGRVIQSIYSKYPIVRVEPIDFPKSYNKAIYADLKVNSDTIRVYNVHLQSFRIVPELEVIQKEEPSNLLRKGGSVIQKQEEQALLIRNHMDTSPHPTVLVGDFNNTQFSKAYRILKGDMEDSFSKGKGFGRSYSLRGFPMRIDYIFADATFDIQSHQNFDEVLSDHYPIMAGLRFKRN